MINQNPWPLTPEDIRLAKALGEPAVDYSDLDLTPYTYDGSVSVRAKAQPRPATGPRPHPLRGLAITIAVVLLIDAALLSPFFLLPLLKP